MRGANSSQDMLDVGLQFPEDSDSEMGDKCQGQGNYDEAPQKQDEYLRRSRAILAAELNKGEFSDDDEEEMVELGIQRPKDYQMPGKLDEFTWKKCPSPGVYFLRPHNSEFGYFKYTVTECKREHMEYIPQDPFKHSVHEAYATQRHKHVKKRTGDYFVLNSLMPTEDISKKLNK